MFARHFFSALHAGRSVKDAFDCGVAVLACHDEAILQSDACAFVLLPCGADHSEKFMGESMSSRPAPSLPPDGGYWGALPPCVEDFLGREVDTQALFRLASSRRCIELQGESGVGKSALMAEVGRFALLRKESFHEVRWISEVTAETEQGLQDLRERLAAGPQQQRRVLLLIDNPAAIGWLSVRALLCMARVHTIVAAAGSSSLEASAGPVIAAAGLKLVRFPVPPLEPIAQARLLLRRSSRPLYSFEVSEELGVSLKARPPSATASILCPRCPADFLALASSPLLRDLGGIPARIVAAAHKLRSVAVEEKTPPLPECQPLSPARPSIQKLAKVRLVRPDGRTRDELLPQEWLISDVISRLAPREMCGAADVFIKGFRAQPSMPLMAFQDLEEQGLLLLEFRVQAGDDW